MMSSRFIRPLIGATISGVLYFLGFVGFGHAYFTWICFVPLLLSTVDLSPKEMVGVAVWFGFVTNTGGYYWVIHLLHSFADLNVALSVLGYLLLCLYQGLLLAVAMVVVQIGRRRLALPPVVSLPIALVVLEGFFPLLFVHYIGNAQYRLLPVTQIVEWTGMLGLTALIAAVNGAFFEMLEARLSARRLRIPHVAIPFLLLAGSVVYGVWRLEDLRERITSAPKLKVALIQANLGARDKRAKASEFRRRHVQMTREVIDRVQDVDLVVWPESAYNRYIPRDVDNLNRVFGDLRRPLITGALTVDPKDLSKRYNTALASDHDGRIVGRYDKIVLLMFGETIPLVERFPVLREWLPRSSVFERGTQKKPLAVAGTTLLPMICYEDILPEQVRDLWRAGGPAELLVNITNDSWYGDSHEPLIHLVLASFRSIETRRALIRSTNTGISALVDPTGAITDRTGQWTQETLVGTVPLTTDGQETFYMRYGDYLRWIALAFLAFGYFVLKRPRPQMPRKAPDLHVV